MERAEFLDDRHIGHQETSETEDLLAAPHATYPHEDARGVEECADPEEACDQETMENPKFGELKFHDDPADDHKKGREEGFARQFAEDLYEGVPYEGDIQ